ncbi:MULTISPECIES: hypothetical protein [Desulfovibrio]|uniref:hypothetical protein n=1 Tax=Desulfovibrio TaxID=872 RepID=UPI0026F149EE|nr:hypothetical protein [Desulfovibrio piger]
MIAVFSDSEQRQTSQDKAILVPEADMRKVYLCNILKSLIKNLYLTKAHQNAGEKESLEKAYFYQMVEICRIHKHALCGTNGI